MHVVLQYSLDPSLRVMASVQTSCMFESRVVLWKSMHFHCCKFQFWSGIVRKHAVSPQTVLNRFILQGFLVMSRECRANVQLSHLKTGKQLYLVTVKVSEKQLGTL